MKKLLTIIMLTALVLTGCSAQTSDNLPVDEMQIIAAPVAVYKKLDVAIQERALPISDEELLPMLAENEELIDKSEEYLDFYRTIKRDGNIHRIVSSMDNPYDKGRFAYVVFVGSDSYDMNNWGSMLRFACDVYGVTYSSELFEAAKNYTSERSIIHGPTRLSIQLGDAFCYILFNSAYHKSYTNYALSAIQICDAEGKAYFERTSVEGIIGAMNVKNVPARAVPSIELLNSPQEREYEIVMIKGTIKDIHNVDEKHLPSFTLPYSVVPPYAGDYEKATLVAWDGEQEIWIRCRTLSSEQLGEELCHYFFRNTKTNEFVLFGSTTEPVLQNTFEVLNAQ